MASKYAQIADCIDPLVTVDQSDVENADVYVDGVLFERGIHPTDIALPNQRLTALAVTWALRLASVKGVIDENSPLTNKSREYQKNAELLAKQLSRESLGLTVAAGSGYGTVTLGRG